MKLMLLVTLGLISIIADDTHLLQTFNDRHLKFTSKIYKELLRTNLGNFVVCPISIDIILAMVHAGVAGKTSKQLIDGLQLPERTEVIQETFNTLIPKLGEDLYYNLSSVNKIYVQDGFKISDSYKTTISKVFQGEIENIDFKQRDKAVKTVNSWIKERTSNAIVNVINKDDLVDDINMVLISTMYFQEFQYSFSRSTTKKRDFYLNTNDKVQVDMMQAIGFYQYYESDELSAKFLQILFFLSGNVVTTTIALPNNTEGLSELESKIDQVLVDPPYTDNYVKIFMPKFKIESTIKFKSILQSLGIVDVFEDEADFTEIGDNQNPIKISNIFQKVIIELNEDGTNADYKPPPEGLDDTSDYYMDFETPILFQADHPFLYIIKINNVNAFVGRVTLFPHIDNKNLNDVDDKEPTTKKEIKNDAKDGIFTGENGKQTSSKNQQKNKTIAVLQKGNNSTEKPTTKMRIKNDVIFTSDIRKKPTSKKQQKKKAQKPNKEIITSIVDEYTCPCNLN